MATDRSLKTKALAEAAKNFVMLAHKYNPGVHRVVPVRKVDRNISSWWIYQKIDGVRARFHKGQLYSRHQKPFSAPQWFLEDILESGGDQELDGELVHSGGFQATVKAVRKSVNVDEDLWEDVKYVVFDVVERKMNFYDRNNWMKDLAVGQGKYTKLLKKTGLVTSESSITDALDKAVSKGQEGLILRNPDGRYKFGRSWDLLKVKKFQDIEVEIVDTYEGEGENAGILGGVVCKMSTDKTFDCGTGFTKEERRNPPTIGSQITVRYFELTDAGVPRFPVYITVRDYESNN